MKRFVALTFTLALATGCLPTRSGTPFADGDDNGTANNVEPNNGNNTVPDGGNNTVPDGGNNTVPDGGNNTVPDGGNNTVPDGGNNNLPDMPPPDDMCVPEDDPTFCGRHGADCDELTSADNCAVQRTVDCGPCQQGEQCVNNMCEPCDAESDDQFCQRLDVECGAYTGLDNCMEERTVDCGGCMGDGVGCNLNNACVETACDDDIDNDGQNGADCDDPNCLGQRCSPSPNKVCQADGSCA